MSRSAFNVVPGQQRFDIRPWGERWNDVAEDVHVGAEVLENLFQILLLFVGTLQIGVLVLLRDYKHVHHEAVSHPIKNALADGLLQAIQAARQVFDLDGDAVIVDREVRPVLFNEKVNAANGRVLVDLGHDLAVDTVGIGINRGHERQFKLPL